MAEKITKVAALAAVIVLAAILIVVLFTARRLSTVVPPRIAKVSVPVTALAVTPGQKVFAVQVASFPDKMKSDIVAGTVKKAGYSVEVVPGTMPDKKIWYRVLVGDFDTMEKAKSCLAQMQKLYKGSFIKQKI